jgi:hypothetical protein
MQSGAHAPTVVPGSAATSLLAQKLLGTQTVGAAMPMGTSLGQNEIQIILDWINAGAADN